jgi:Tfp pilus assembly protein PilX
MSPDAFQLRVDGRAVQSRAVPSSDVRRFVPAGRRRQAGVMLAECLVYIGVWVMITGLAFTAFFRVLDNAKRLRRNAADIARALQAGERWREDIRSATGSVKLVTVEGAPDQALHIPQHSGEVIYFFTGTNVVRRANATASWVETLVAVRTSNMIEDRRPRVTAWRWEVELQPVKKTSLTRPLFSFQSVPPFQDKP